MRYIRVRYIYLCEVSIYLSLSPFYFVYIWWCTQDKMEKDYIIINILFFLFAKGKKNRIEKPHRKTTRPLGWRPAQAFYSKNHKNTPYNTLQNMIKQIFTHLKRGNKVCFKVPWFYKARKTHKHTHSLSSNFCKQQKYCIYSVLSI